MADHANAPAGWYRDPHGQDRQRYWDGVRWTDHTAAFPTPRTSGGPSGTSPSGRVKKRWWVLGGVLLLLLVVGVLTGNDSEGPTTSSDAGARHLADDAVAEETPTTTAPPSVAEVPEVIGMTRASARAELRAAGLTIGSVRRQPSASPVGTVLSQSLAPGSAVSPGSRVALVVASPLPRVPGVVGTSQAEATAALEARGFKVRTSTRVVRSGEDGVVLSQTPAAGRGVRPGTTIHLVIADYQPPAPAPAPFASGCTPGYSPCLPPASDYDCGGGSGNGPKYVEGTVQVTGSDPYDLDRDGNGIGCD